MAALLEEKIGAETRAAEAENLLSDARAAASRAEETVSGLEAALTVAKNKHTAGTTGHTREKRAATGEEPSHVRATTTTPQQYLSRKPMNVSTGSRAQLSPMGAPFSNIICASKYDGPSAYKHMS